MMEAEQLRRVIRENFSFDDTMDCNVSDPESESDSGDGVDVAAVKNGQGETSTVAANVTERQSPVPSVEEDTPTLTQVSDHGDSQATEIGDGDDDDVTGNQARSSSVSTSTAGVAIAFDLYRSQEGGGRSGRSVSERAPSRTNGVPDDTLVCPSPI